MISYRINEIIKNFIYKILCNFLKFYKEEILSETKYGNIKYSSSIFKKNIFGFQFHPEKSGIEGLKIYKDFYEIIKSNK